MLFDGFHPVGSVVGTPKLEFFFNVLGLPGGQKANGAKPASHNDAILEMTSRHYISSVAYQTEHAILTFLRALVKMQHACMPSFTA